MFRMSENVMSSVISTSLPIMEILSQIVCTVVVTQRTCGDSGSANDSIISMSLQFHSCVVEKLKVMHNVAHFLKFIMHWFLIL